MIKKLIGPTAFLTQICCITLPSQAYAQAMCGGVGQVQRILTYRDGAILIQSTYRGDFTQICNLATVWKDVRTETCFAWFSKISEGIIQNKFIGIYYASSEPNFCATLPTYGNSPAPVYIQLAN